jgi:uracil phosphoribosyltransferase
VERAVVVPILRSGLQMVSSFLALLPSDTAVHHLGLFRDKHTLAPVEYYNKLPALEAQGQHVDVAFVVDPIIATGGTAATVVAILREWGVRKIIFTSILASSGGLERAANEWPEGYSPWQAETYGLARFSMLAQLIRN